MSTYRGESARNMRNVECAQLKQQDTSSGASDQVSLEQKLLNHRELRDIHRDQQDRSGQNNTQQNNNNKLIKNNINEIYKLVTQ